MHYFFMDEALPRDPFPVAGQSCLPDAVTLMASSSSTTEQRTVTSDWRAIGSASRMRYGKKRVKAIRLDDTRARFGRRKSPAQGHSQVTGQSRKVAPQVLNTTRVLGTTGSASDMVANKTKERLELRQNIR